MLLCVSCRKLLPTRRPNWEITATGEFVGFRERASKTRRDKNKTGQRRPRAQTDRQTGSSTEGLFPVFILGQCSALMSLGGSLWLVPHPTSHVSDALQDKIAELSERNSWGVGVSKVFKPHMTITSSITDYFLSQSKSKVDFPGYNFVHLHEIKMLAPELKFKEIVMGELFL